MRESVKSDQTTDGEWKEEDPISMPQTNFIDSKCKQLDINVIEFINHGKESYTSINQVSKKTASKMLSLLNEYQNKSKNIPEDVLGYNANWR